jgi:hypothetical protein
LQIKLKKRPNTPNTTPSHSKKPDYKAINQEKEEKRRPLLQILKIINKFIYLC